MSGVSTRPDKSSSMTDSASGRVRSSRRSVLFINLRVEFILATVQWLPYLAGDAGLK